MIQALPEKILKIRGQQVMLDADLAELFGVPTKRFNEQIKRNLGRFPSDFMFTLTIKEKAEVVANCDHLGKLRFSSFLNRAFTEHGALMAATVLNSPRAIEMSVYCPSFCQAAPGAFFPSGTVRKIQGTGRTSGRP